MAELSSCKWACETILNYTLYTCPGIASTFDPDAYSMTAGNADCVEQCMGYADGHWWHFTDLRSFFNCFDVYAPQCNYWELYRNCSPMRDEMLFSFEILSFLCCLVLLYRLYKEAHKGMLQQSLFISITHNLLQALISEEFYNICAMYLIPKGDSQWIIGLAMRFGHVWIIFGSLVWSLVTAVVLLRITEGQKRCQSVVAFCQRHKTLIIVLFECTMILMSALSVVARIKVWNNFFLGFLVTCLVAVLAGVICYSVPALRARSMQKKLIASQLERHKTSSTSASARKSVIDLRLKVPDTRIQIKPFLLLLTVLVFTYIPFFAVYAQPADQRTRAGYLVAWSFLELVGVWNFIGLLIVYFGRSKVTAKFMRVWVRNDRLIGRGNLVVIGSHSFFRRHDELFWRLNPETTPFGEGCMAEDLDDRISGDIEQTTKGTLVRWMKRPSRFAQNSVHAIGLPLDKMLLFVDAILAPWFPQDSLVPLPPFGFTFAVNVTVRDVEHQRLQIQAVAEYEEAGMHWRSLHDDRSASTEDVANSFEQAQLNWAYEEAGLKLRSAIEVLMRWKRSPVSQSGSSSSPRSADGLLSSGDEKQLWSGPLPISPEPSEEVILVSDLPDTTESPDTRKDVPSEELRKSVTASQGIDTQMALFT